MVRLYEDVLTPEALSAEVDQEVQNLCAGAQQAFDLDQPGIGLALVKFILREYARVPLIYPRLLELLRKNKRSDMAMVVLEFARTKVQMPPDIAAQVDVLAGQLGV